MVFTCLLHKTQPYIAITQHLTRCLGLTLESTWTVKVLC
uniref:Uncharacterized protein n=1 Tax=Anguilla anguilla TaxID=7936 RepID=A0A0E9P938_ANGAN